MNKNITILIVDDENDICDLTAGILNDAGYSTCCANCYEQAIKLIDKYNPNIAILDVWLGENEKDGLRILSYINSNFPDIISIMMSGHSTISTAVQAIKNGAHDFIEKPFDSNRLLVSTEKAIEMLTIKNENNNLKLKLKEINGILGISENAITIRKLINQYAQSNGRCIIFAPRGSDKEGVAREIHKLSNRSKASFYSFNCLNKNKHQIEIDLYGSEIITYQKVSINKGIFEKTGDGTLFIDNLDVIPVDLQMKLLRTLVSGRYKRVGSNNSDLILNARIISGIFQNENNINTELMYRLGPNEIKILPLNMRTQDIPHILQFYLDQATTINHLQRFIIPSEVLDLLMTYNWPGDVMELKNTVDWILNNVFSKSKPTNIIQICDLPPNITKIPSNASDSAMFTNTVADLDIKKAKMLFEKEYFKKQLQKFSGNISKVSQFTGMERSALYRKLKQLKISDNK